MLLLVPGAVLFIIAMLVRRFPPLRMNQWYGYRTRRSLSSPEAWKEANAFAGRLLLWGALLVLNTGITCWLLVTTPDTALLIVSVITALVLIAVPLATEQRLRALFGDPAP
jgi:uncharacterized membrane protein